MPFGVIIVGRDKVIRHANRNALNLAGYESVEALVGQSCQATLCSVQPEQCPILDLNQKIDQSERVLVTKNGREIPILKSAVPVTIDSEEILLEAFVDITRMKEIEEEKHLLKIQLYQAQKMEAIGTLAGGIAHDFNNILGALIGYAELVKDDIVEGTVTHQNLEEILVAAQRAKELVKQILTFSRKDKTQLVPMQINNVVQSTIKMLRSSLPATIGIHQQIDAAGCVMADETQIHQIMLNLATNAAHAMEENRGNLEITVSDIEVDLDRVIRDRPLPRGSYVRLTVKDTGCGMSEEIMARIFEPFYTTKEVNKGTGLGLSVVHGIVENHHGTMTVDSIPGQGTSFEIYFPCIDCEAMREPEEPEAACGQGERILVVDDETTLVNMTMQTLRRMGYDAVGKTSSVEALALFKANPNAFDLVITDQTMPTMKGTELAKNLLHIRPDVPIVLCSGYSESINPDAVKAIGIKKFVMKPISRKTWSELIRELAGKKEALA